MSWRGHEELPYSLQLVLGQDGGGGKEGTSGLLERPPQDWWLLSPELVWTWAPWAAGIVNRLSMLGGSPSPTFSNGEWEKGGVLMSGFLALTL